ncbi:iron ABC transporter permease [Streptomyces sp. AJS327]|uniref:FecCD family ABC transporter permease n=1 Tax=Streptomyces sp. AJS327 TaxID=2545265 RepID=UPI0015DE4B22|nr:iron ABC transporter permease [Streptomyces sp. AJS327]MBA0052519.1 iron ABC transporter permease [Streptomyces sp. AJS327]
MAASEVETPVSGRAPTPHAPAGDERGPDASAPPGHAAGDPERTDGAPVRGRRRAALPLLALGTLLVALGALALGRYLVPPNEILRMIGGQVLPLARTWTPTEEAVVLDVRLPRVLLALLVGGGLALSGAALQGVFRNPLVSPDVIGVSSGASLGGVLALLFGLGSLQLVTGAFAFGLLALAIVLLVGGRAGGSPLLMIILAGTVTGAFFSALVSFATYVADPYTELPSIVFWLLGSLATASYGKVLVAVGPVLAGALVVLCLRWRLNVLSLGDEDAASLGVPPRPTRLLLLTAVALITAGSVAVSGLVGWVGLVVPHLARLWAGTDHRVLLPASFLLGGAYLTVIDTLSRCLTSGEMPLGILTAVIGAPFFVVLLARSRDRMWIND